MSETISERIFFDYCKIRKYEAQKLTESDEPIPDFKVKTHRGTFYCEVTQLERNDEDKKWYEEVKQNGGSWSGSRSCAEISKKIRNRLKDKFERKQLRPHSQADFPTLLVIFDATGRSYLNDFTLYGAMYGDHQAWISNDLNEAAIFEQGGNRQFQPDKGSYISAVAILSSTPSLEILHNNFADVPFPPILLSDPEDKHSPRTSLKPVE